MEVFGEQVNYPTFEEICRVNVQLVAESGGEYVPPDNLLNPGSLEYILTAIRSPVFGVDLYPTFKEKEAAIGSQIISRHVFIDGNKRTGAMTAWALLRETRARVSLDSSIEEITVAIASGDAGYPELLRWLHDHQAGG